MDWHITEALSMATADYAIGEHNLAPAEYEIVRQVVLTTGDIDYKNLLQFSDQALQAGASAIASRIPIVVDSLAIHAVTSFAISQTFANLTVCAGLVSPMTQSRKDPIAAGLYQLAQEYPEAIYVIGGFESALVELLSLVEKEAVSPSFVIACPACLVTGNDLKQRLVQTGIPHIRSEGVKGNSAVASAVLTGLVELAWQAYGEIPQI
jgi:precorrin-8X/cobalt-precorrin-8 methylmutase